MTRFLENALYYIDQYSYALYVVATLGILWYTRRARRAWRERRFTPFHIEREEATTALRDSMLVIFILIAILATTYYIDRILLPNQSSLITPASPNLWIDIVATPTSPVIPVTPYATATATALPLLTATVTIPPASQQPPTVPLLPTATSPISSTLLSPAGLAGSSSSIPTQTPSLIPRP